MALTVVQVKSAKPREKAYKLADDKGLYLLVNPNGSKLWKLKYRFAGVEKKLSLGFFLQYHYQQLEKHEKKLRNSSLTTLTLVYLRTLLSDLKG